MSPDRSPRDDRERADEPRHPSFDPSGDEPAGSSTGVPGRASEAAGVPIRTEAPLEDEAPRRTPQSGDDSP